MTAIQQAPLSNCVLAPVPPGSLIVDTCSPVSAGQARGLRAQNVVGVMRYLGGWASDLTAKEALGILAAGLGLGFVQHGHEVGWQASGLLGTSWGQAMLRRAQAFGVPQTAPLYCDQEGLAGYSSDGHGHPIGSPQAADQIILYLDNWSAPVDGGGYVAGLYVGAGAGLDGARLGGLARYHSYWKSGSTVPVPMPRRWQLVQEDHETVLRMPLDPATGKPCGAPLRVDRNFSCRDARGDLLRLCFLAEAMPARQVA